MLATIEIQLNERIALTDLNAVIRLFESVYAAAESAESPDVERVPLHMEYVGFGRSALRMRGAPKSTGRLAAWAAKVLIPLLSAVAGAGTKTVVEYLLSGDAKATQDEIRRTCPEAEQLICEVGDAACRTLKPNGTVTYSLTSADGAEKLNGLTTPDILAVESALKESELPPAAIGEILYVLGRAATKKNTALQARSSDHVGYRGVASVAATIPDALDDAYPDALQPAVQGPAMSSEDWNTLKEAILRRFCAGFAVTDFVSNGGNESEIPLLMSFDQRSREKLLRTIRDRRKTQANATTVTVSELGS